MFFGKRRECLKVLFFDGTGLFYKRLDRGTFRLPSVPEGTTTLAIEERVLDDLLDGVDLDPPAKPRRSTTHYASIVIVGSRHRDRGSVEQICDREPALAAERARADEAIAERDRLREGYTVPPPAAELPAH